MLAALVCTNTVITHWPLTASVSPAPPTNTCVPFAAAVRVPARADPAVQLATAPGVAVFTRLAG